jgi:hypothetical protein
MMQYAGPTLNTEYQVKLNAEQMLGAAKTM